MAKILKLNLYRQSKHNKLHKKEENVQFFHTYLPVNLFGEPCQEQPRQ